MDHQNEVTLPSEDVVPDSNAQQPQRQQDDDEISALASSHKKKKDTETPKEIERLRSESPILQRIKDESERIYQQIASQQEQNLEALSIDKKTKRLFKNRQSASKSYIRTKLYTKLIHEVVVKMESMIKDDFRAKKLEQHISDLHSQYEYVSQEYQRKNQRLDKKCTLYQDQIQHLQGQLNRCSSSALFPAGVAQISEGVKQQAFIFDAKHQEQDVLEPSPTSVIQYSPRRQETVCHTTPTFRMPAPVHMSTDEFWKLLSTDLEPISNVDEKYLADLGQNSETQE